MQEHDLDGGNTPLPAGTAIVDINSHITIGINKDALANRVCAGSPNLATAALVSDYVAFQTAATKLAVAVDPLRRALQNLREEGKEASLDAVRKALKPAASAALQLIDYTNPKSSDDSGAAARRASFRESLNQALETSQNVAQQYAAVQSAAMVEISRLQAELRATAAKEGVEILLGAWLGRPSDTSPIHLPGFDTYSDKPRYEVDRFQIVFTEDQKKQYEAAKSAAAQLNAGKGGDVLKDIATTFLESTFAKTLSHVSALEASLKGVVGDTQSTVAAIADDARRLLDDVARQRAWLDDTFAKLRTAIASGPGEASAEIARAVDDFSSRAGAMLAELTAFRQRVDAAAHGATSAVSKLESDIDTTIGSLNTDVKTVWDGARTAMAGFAINAAALEFGKQIKRFSIEDLPASTELDLELTGARARGDQVVVKVGLQRGAERIDDLEARHLLLLRVLVHVETSAGLVFARPLRGASVVGNGGFQAAPSYAAFLKSDSRRCHFWNNVLNPGIGLSVAALDFNLDGSPEVGLGATVSLFRDWLQGGAGYNLFENRWYGFIGIGLPLPTFGMTKTSSGQGPSSSQN
jgi:hypothetical protein